MTLRRNPRLIDLSAAARGDLKQLSGTAVAPTDEEAQMPAGPRSKRPGITVKNIYLASQGRFAASGQFLELSCLYI